jgi:hypothetical protein
MSIPDYQNMSNLYKGMPMADALYGELLSGRYKMFVSSFRAGFGRNRRGPGRI